MDEMIIQERDNKGKALASLILGLVGIVAWFIPLFGLPITIVGLIMGILGRKSSKKKLALIGIVLCVIFLIITLINAGMGAYLGVQRML